MCDDHLTCPSCGAELAAECVIAGDNATGFYVEFFLVRVTGTSVQGAFRGVPTATATSPVVSPPILTGDADVTARFPTERGFDDDEAPSPTIGSLELRR